jgi:hypothetical protein
MRIIEINDNEVASHKSVYIMDYIRVMKGYDDGKFLNIEYDNPNDGSDTVNTATIENDINHDFFGCKIRFVMKKGAYVINNGTLQQVIENDSVSVYDVKVSVDGNDTKSVTIKPGPTALFKQKRKVTGGKLLSVTCTPQGLQLQVNESVKAIRSLHIFNAKGTLVKTYSPMDLASPKPGMHLNYRGSHGIYVIRCSLVTHDGRLRASMFKVPMLE